MYNEAEDAARVRSPDLEEEEETLAALAREVAEDAQQTPEAYLRETIVPEGGE